jgi:hypothetical protein
MAGYIDLQFENHPTIAAEYLKFLATNSGHEKVDELEISIKDQQEDVTAALTKAKAAVSKADIATGKSETVKAHLDALTKRVSALEKADSHHKKVQKKEPSTRVNDSRELATTNDTDLVRHYSAPSVVYARDARS